MIQVRKWTVFLVMKRLNKFYPGAEEFDPASLIQDKVSKEKNKKNFNTRRRLKTRR